LRPKPKRDVCVGPSKDLNKVQGRGNGQMAANKEQSTSKKEKRHRNGEAPTLKNKNLGRQESFDHQKKAMTSSVIGDVQHHRPKHKPRPKTRNY